MVVDVGVGGREIRTRWKVIGELSSFKMFPLPRSVGAAEVDERRIPKPISAFLPEPKVLPTAIRTAGKDHTLFNIRKRSAIRGARMYIYHFVDTYYADAVYTCINSTHVMLPTCCPAQQRP